MYLDCLNFCNVSVMHTRMSLAAILSHQELKKIHNADMIVRGKIHLDTYKFGKLPICSQFQFLYVLSLSPFLFFATLKCEPIYFLTCGLLFLWYYSGRR